MDSGPQDFLCKGLASSNFFHQPWFFFSLSFPCYSCRIHIVLFFINWKHGSYENIAIKVRNPLFLPFLIHPYALNYRNSLKILKKYFYVFFVILTPFSSNVDLRKMYSIILYTRFTSSLKFHLYPPSRTWQLFPVNQYRSNLALSLHDAIVTFVCCHLHHLQDRSTRGSLRIQFKTRMWEENLDTFSCQDMLLSWMTLTSPDCPASAELDWSSRVTSKSPLTIIVSPECEESASWSLRFQYKLLSDAPHTRVSLESELEEQEEQHLWEETFSTKPLVSASWSRRTVDLCKMSGWGQGSSASGNCKLSIFLHGS